MQLSINRKTYLSQENSMHQYTDRADCSLTSITSIFNTRYQYKENMR